MKNILDQKKSQKYSKLLLDHSKIGIIKESLNALDNLQDINTYLGITPSLKEKRKICYCRVSSKKQMDDLERQKDFFRREYPDHELVTDVGSGLNWKRKGLKTILEQSML